MTWKNVDGRKIPFDAKTGRAAKSDDPATWASFEEAYHAYQHRHHTGIGYVFSADDPYVGIDLDDCIADDGTITLWAVNILAAMASYAEVSPSGTGIKIWVEGAIARSVKTKQTEIYDRTRYFTVTGHLVEGAPPAIRAVNGELTQLCASLQPERPPDPPRAAPARPTPDTPRAAARCRSWCLAALDGEIEKMLAAGDGERHNRRFDSAHALGGLVHTGGITEQEIFDGLSVNFGADRRSAEQTIWDGIAQGKEHPRNDIPDFTDELPPIAPIAADDNLDELDPEMLRSRLRAAIAERDQWKARAQQLELQLGHVQEHNRFVTQSCGAEGIDTPSMRLTFIELKKEIDRVPLEERAPDQFVRVRPAYMATCSNQKASSISRHLGEFEKADLIEKQVRRTYDAEADKWYSETFVRPKVDLSDPTKVVIPCKPRGKQACKHCGSERLVREVRVICANCKCEQSFEQGWLNPPEGELQTAIQDEDLAPNREQVPAINVDGLNCKLQNKNEDSSVRLFMCAGANQTGSASEAEPAQVPTPIAPPAEHRNPERIGAPPPLVSWEDLQELHAVRIEAEDPKRAAYLRQVAASSGTPAAQAVPSGALPSC